MTSAPRQNSRLTHALAVWSSPKLGGEGHGVFTYKGGRTETIPNIGWQIGMQVRVRQWLYRP